MARGELSARERADLDTVIRAAEQASRVQFSIFRGRSQGDPRTFALALHASLAAPDRSILIMVDPTLRAIEIVTGAEVRRTLGDRETSLAVAAMQGSFAEGDHVGGLQRGINLLAENARTPQTMHVKD